MPEQLERYEQKPLSEQTKQNLMDQLTLADHLVYKKYLPDLQNYALVDPTEQMVGGKITDDYMKVFKLEELTVKQGKTSSRNSQRCTIPAWHLDAVWQFWSASKSLGRLHQSTLVYGGIYGRRTAKR